MTPTIEFTLLLVLASAQRSPELLLQTLREIGSSDVDGKRMIGHAQRLMPERDYDWLKASLKKLYDDPSNSRNLPVYSYLWELSEEKPLEVAVQFRLNAEEARQLQALADNGNGSMGVIARKLLRDVLAGSCIQQG
jgi:hypothetical protein